MSVSGHPIVMSLTGNESTQSIDFFQAVEFDKSYSYEVGLIGFEFQNSISNVNSSNNRLYYGDPGNFICLL